MESPRMCLNKISSLWKLQSGGGGVSPVILLIFLFSESSLWAQYTVLTWNAIFLQWLIRQKKKSSLEADIACFDKEDRNVLELSYGI